MPTYDGKTFENYVIYWNADLGQDHICFAFWLYVVLRCIRYRQLTKWNSGLQIQQGIRLKITVMI